MLSVEEIRKQADEFLEDSEKWLTLLQEYWDVLVDLVSKIGKTEETRRSIILFYKMKLRLMERTLQFQETNKNRTIQSSCDPNILYNIATQQLEVEKIKEDLLNFILTDKLPEV